MRSTSTHLWLAIRLPDLPLTAIKPDVMTTPVVIADKKRVVFANPSAQHAGVQLDMDITTAQLLSGCEILERHPADDEPVALNLKLSDPIRPAGACWSRQTTCTAGPRRPSRGRASAGRCA